MKLAEIAARLRCELQGDGGIEIDSVAPIDNAPPGSLTFLANPRYRSQLETTGAAAAIVGHGEPRVPLPCLRTSDPYLAFAQAIELFYVPPPLSPGIHPTAVIAPGARLGSDVAVGAYSVVGEDVVIGDGTRLDAHVVVYPQARIGAQCRLFAHTTLRERVSLGNRVIVHSGCVIGSDGFGYVLGPEGARKILQAGTVIIEDDVEIGANTTGIVSKNRCHSRTRRARSASAFM